MNLEAGHKLGPYEIIERAGAGGMGEVYKAKDSRLDRTVAIKILPSIFAGSPEHKERFEREAKAISSLNHPHICTLYDVGNESGSEYLVMEFLEGETLSERLSRGPVPYEEMVQISVQIASGLDAAHHQGLIHRDLKPGNVMLTREGAKLLDFGLAKVQIGSGPQGMTAITQTTPLTGANTILGTMQYMAPEQLEGKEADARSDIFAFGAIMYEMSTGKKAFEGTSNASLIAAIIEREPISISVIMPMMPPLFERLVKKCLSKDPRKRWQSASDLSDELRWISMAGSQVGLPAHIAARRKLRFDLARVIGLVGFMATLVFAWLYFSERSKTGPEPEVARFSIDLKQGLTNIFWPRISPNGRSVAFHADDSLGVNRIWIRPVNSLEAYPLLNTENANRFFWSPDGQSIAFFVGNQLKRIAISGGQAQLICQGPSGSDGSWGMSDFIIFDGNTSDTMKIVSAEGGVPRPATLIDTTSKEDFHAWPWFLPDGNHFIFRSTYKRDKNGGTGYRIKLGSTESTASTTLFDMDGQIDRIEYSTAGYILYVFQDNLMALPFDDDKLEVTGDPKPVAMKIGAADNTYAFSCSNNGTLLYQLNNQSATSEISWVDRSGKEIEKVIKEGRFSDLALSPDGTKLAYSSVDAGSEIANVWVYDLKRKVPTRLTFSDAINGKALWNLRGDTIYFTSNRGGGVLAMYRRNASGLGQDELVYKADSMAIAPGTFRKDGNSMFTISARSGTWDIDILELGEEPMLRPFLDDPKNFESMPVLSPNGKYLAYVSRESGAREVYVTKADGTGGKWQISNEGADNPRWNGNGTELFYLTNDNQICTVKTNTSGDFEASNSTSLFTLRFQYVGNVVFPYDVSSDGQRFVVNARIADSDPGEIVVVQNWAEEFNKGLKLK